MALEYIIMSKVTYLGVLLILTTTGRIGDCRAERTPSKNEDFEIIKSEGPIMSANFPLQYRNNDKIKYRVLAPSNEVIQLRFTHLDVESNDMTKECHDKLEISEVASFNKTTLLRTLCGCLLPSPILSTVNKMDILFTTDHTTTRTGFYAIVSFIDPNDYSPRTESSSKISTCSLIVTLIVATLSFLIGFRFHKRLMELEENVSGIHLINPGLDIVPSINEYQEANESDNTHNKSANKLEDSENVGGYIRMRPSKKHVKPKPKPLEEKVYAVPDAVCDQDKSPEPSADYAQSIPNPSEYQHISDDVVYDQYTPAQYEQPGNITDSAPTKPEADSTAPNTYYSPEAYAAIIDSSTSSPTDAKELADDAIDILTN
ncbi:uncharacterized protein [Apostichopus japonicus]|uniref:uncharacterized protein isoform X2 n=1 Tax=Stichopus japonicus TaxID=307972 RepID=UPI003AB1AB10